MFVEPDAKVVQRNSRRQTSPQSRHVVGALSAKAESVVQLFVDDLYDLAYGSCPTSKALGPSPFASVAFGRADYAHPVEIEPPAMVLFAFEASIGYVGPKGIVKVRLG